MKTKIFLFAILQLSVMSINAQNLETALGGIKTDFLFFSDTTDLNAADQIIIRRAERNSYSDASFGTGWGYGYQSFHLEFMSAKNLVEEKFRYRAGRDNNDKLELTFYSSDDVELATYQMDFSGADVLYNPSSDRSQFFYSIDLIDIPVVLLGKTAKINLIKKVADRGAKE